MEKKIFCSFADARLSKSLYRIEKQAKIMSVYDRINVYNESDLNPHFKLKFKDKLTKHSRGFGYWCWKPQIILQTLLSMNDGDLMQYTDAGCHLNPNGAVRLKEYFAITAKSKSGILLFRDPNIKECQFTKADLFEYLNVLNDKSITHSNQIYGGVWFIRKDESTIAFLKSCIAVFEAGFSLIDDSASKHPNFEGFKDHRHDQSISSVLAKIKGVEELSSNELYTSGDWSDLNDFPIWAMRDKNYGAFHKFKKAVYPLYKLLFNS